MSEVRPENLAGRRPVARPGPGRARPASTAPAKRWLGLDPRMPAAAGAPPRNRPDTPAAMLPTIMTPRATPRRRGGVAAVLAGAAVAALVAAALLLPARAADMSAGKLAEMYSKCRGDPNAFEPTDIFQLCKQTSPDRCGQEAVRPSRRPV